MVAVWRAVGLLGLAVGAGAVAVRERTLRDLGPAALGEGARGAPVSEANGVPVVDLVALEVALAGGDSVVAGAMRKALFDKGMFYLRNVGFDVDARASALGAVTARVMSQPPEVTRKYVSKGLVPTGLAPLESESVAKAFGLGNFSDIAAKWSMQSNESLASNVWPEEDAVFHPVWISHTEGAARAAQRLLRAVAVAVGAESRADWRGVLESHGTQWQLRHLRYPDVPADRCADRAPVPERMVAHHDLDLLTLIHQTPSPNGFVSLQAQFPGESGWTDIPPVPNTIVVNAGEVLSMLTSGNITATMHRVTVPTVARRVGSARASTVLFLLPRNEFPVRPLSDTSHRVGEEVLPYREWLNRAFAKLRPMAQQSA